MLRVAIVVGSTRPGRKAEDVARWVYELASKRGDATYEVVEHLFHFKNGKIQTFNCYAAGTIMFMQLGVLGNLGAALKQ
jgi:NAD(P)H-dependent FMN reductase